MWTQAKGDIFQNNFVEKLTTWATNESGWMMHLLRRRVILRGTGNSTIPIDMHREPLYLNNILIREKATK